jgi:hypothetical protein
MSPLRRSILAFGTVGIVVVSGLLLGGQRTAWACGATDSGTSGVYDTSNGLLGGTSFIKQPPGCNDFNLTANISDSGNGFGFYAGFYLSGSTVIEGTRGFTKITDRKTQGADVVLLSSVGTGTKMWVGTTQTPSSVTVQH